MERTSAAPALPSIFLLLAILILPIPLSMAPARAGEDAAAEQLQELLNNFLEGASENDSAMHDRFWSDDLVYTSSAGQRFGKADIMEALAEAGEQPEAEAAPRFTGEEVQIRVFGNTAVVTFELVATHAAGAESRYYNTGAFRQEDGKWRAIAWQATAQDQ